MDSIKPRLLAGIFFVSSATLCLEVTLTRYFSISQDYHFAFLVISMAFLGYGASGSFLTLFENLRNKDHDKFLTVSSFLLALMIILSFILANSLPFDFMKLIWDKNQVFIIFFYYLVLSLPFFFAGLTISFATAKFSRFVNRIYFFDLIGAGTGSFIAALVFFPRGEKGVFLCVSLLALTASLLFCPRQQPLLKIFLLLALSGEAALFFYSPAWLSFRISPYKALPIALKYPQSTRSLTKWNALSRVDVIQSPAVRYAPGLSLVFEEKLPSQVGLSLDGGELSAVTHFKNLQDKNLEFISYLPSSLAYSFVQAPRTLIIEPKGGLDVLSALYFRASPIKVIESNPLLIHLMRQDLASANGYLYHQKNIQIASAHPREVLSKEKQLYDLIIFSLTDVFGAASSGLYGFHENYLYTVESFKQILSRLSSQGVISMTLYLLPPPRQELKLLATWVEALEELGKNPASCLVAIQTWGTISYFIKKSPFEETDIQKLKDFVQKRLFDLVYYPGISATEVNIYNVSEKPVYYDFVLQILSPQKRTELYKKYLFSIRPASDNRPFFSSIYKLSQIRKTYRALGQKLLPLFQGSLLIPLLVVQSAFVAFFLIFLPVFVFSKKKKVKRLFSFKICAYFSLIGASFMFLEIIFIQKFILFLGHPLYSISTVIFSLLFSSGLGSLLSQRVLGESFEKKIKIVLLFCAILIPFYLFLFPILYANCIGFHLPGKIFMTFLAIFPLGFLLGFPFPTGIRLLRSHQANLIPWAWASNAFSSVVNSVLAGWIALWAGYNLVLILACGGYLFSVLFLNFADHRHKIHS